MILRRMLGTPSQPGAFPPFSFLIKFLISLGDVYLDGSSLNALLLRTEQLSWTEVNNSDRRVLSWSRENLEAITLAFSDSVIRVSPSSFKAGIPRNLFLIILVKPQKNLWPGFKARSLLPKGIFLGEECRSYSQKYINFTIDFFTSNKSLSSACITENKYFVFKWRAKVDMQ
jgi:hypothetical protein